MASRSYLTYDGEELRDKLTRNPYSYLHVINPQGLETIPVKKGTPSYFMHVRQKLEFFQNQGWIQNSGTPSFAIYRQKHRSHSYTGVIGATSVESIQGNRLKLHEQTLEMRETLFESYLDAVNCHAEPILSAFPEGSPSAQKIQSIIDEAVKGVPDQDFSTTDQTQHTVWMLNPIESLRLSETFDHIPCMYLADGHHRVASSVRLAEQYPDSAQKQLVLTYAIPESQINIEGYHREVHSIKRSRDQWMAELEAWDSVCSFESLAEKETMLPSRGFIHMHTAVGSWKLQIRNLMPHEIDAGWLNRVLLEPFFGISDPRNDSRLRYVSGPSKMLQERVDQHKDRCIFELHPVNMEQLKAVADAGNTLPPKSTWIEPKLRSGLFLYEF